MLKNKKFALYTVAFCILGIIYMFMYSGLQNDHVNIIQTYITADGGGWSATMTQLPKTVGDFVCIALTFAYGTMFIKCGVRKTLIPCILLSALGCVGIVAANGLDVFGGTAAGIYWLYAISLFVIRCTCMCLQMAGFQLAASWFIKYRGRVLGIITVGSPLFSVVGTSVMTNFINNHLGGDYRPFYIGIAVILAVIALLTRILLKDTPEEAGLYPDGADHAPISEQQNDEIKLTVKQVLSEKRGWIMIISYAAFQFIINGCMSSMAVRFMALGGIDVWLDATTWLAMGAILGIPMSYVFGWIDDKFGTVVASFILGLAEIIPVVALWIMPEGGNVPLEIIWGFGVACMTGGVPTMHPCSISYAYGRREYQSANRIIMSIQLIPSAFAAMMMVALIQAGKASTAFAILFGVIIIGLIATVFMRSIPDMNAADRDYKAKKEKAVEVEAEAEA